MIKLIVDKDQRYAKMRAHTATHLLHFALERTLGMTKQAWSLVDSDYVRFDFSAKKPLTDTQLTTIQQQINQRIVWAYPVQVDECSLEEAKERWAKAFFEEKYGDRVRVVRIDSSSEIKKPKETLTSIELCGWTHVAQTNEIGGFIILWQEAVASWIRRITGVTWPKVAKEYTALQSHLQHIADKLDCQPKQLDQKIDKLLEENDTLRSDNERYQHQHITHALQSIQPASHKAFDYTIWLEACWLQPADIKEIIAVAKQLFSDKDRLIYAKSGVFALYRGKSNDATQRRKKYAIRWWWDNTLIQGKDEKFINTIIG